VNPLKHEYAVRRAVKHGQIQAVRAWLATRPDPMELGKALLAAARTYDVSRSMLEMLIGAGADPNFTYETDEILGPPLSVAASSSRTETATCLVDLGANPKFVNRNGDNAMIFAAISQTACALDMINCLVDLGVDPNAESQWNESPLSIASRRGRFDMIRELLRAGADPSRLGWSPLMHAVALGTSSDCRSILATGPSLADRDRKWERTPFLLAAQVGEVEKAALLLEAGAQLDDRGRCGKTALKHAAEMGHTDLVEWLLAKGADANSVDDFGETALISAASHGAADCVEALLRGGGHAHTETPVGNSAIDQAHNIETVIALRGAGCDIDRINGQGRSVLIDASEDGRLDFVNQLLAIGADPNRADASYAPLHAAVNRDEIEVALALLKGGADPNQPAVDDWTALFYVRTPEAAQLLLDFGADRSCRDSIGRTAADYAKSDELRALLGG
jgi:ankyrin repeat protein